MPKAVRAWLWTVPQSRVAAKDKRPGVALSFSSNCYRRLWLQVILPTSKTEHEEKSFERIEFQFAANEEFRFRR